MKKSFLLCACLVVMAFTLTACGEKNNPETTGTTTGSSTEDSSSTENGNNSNGTGSVGKDLGNMIDDAGDVVDDAAKDVSDALTGNYDTYDHAYKYFMDQIPVITTRILLIITPAAWATTLSFMTPENLTTLRLVTSM